MNRGIGLGFFGRGGGRGWRNWFYATGLTHWQRASLWPSPWGWPGFVSTAPEQEVAALKGVAKRLEDVLDGLRKRVEELESKAKAE
jgi:hypothetical protein